MMCYDGKEGSFPMTIEECVCMQCLCSERISEMALDLENKDPHKFVMIKSLAGKINGFIELMYARREAEKLRVDENYQLRKDLEKITEEEEQDEW